MAAATGFELLVGAEDFWARAAGDIARARRRLRVQAMTFEGDTAGLAVAAAIAASPAADRRVLVDDYSRWVVSDRFIWTPGALLDRALRAEVAATRAMFDGLAADGVGVRVTNAVGPLFARYPARNHKKLIVADDVAYLGGINFSDHNFAWPDLMLRLEGAAAADLLAADFEATFAGVTRPWRENLGDLELHSLDGRGNRAGFAAIFALIEAARREIIVISPYLTFPFTGALAAAARRGVTVRLITPWANNKAIVRNALLASAARAGFEVTLLPGMTHLKALLIDEARLIVGSSNFDFVSLAAEEELIAVVGDRALIADFQRRIVAPAMAEARIEPKARPRLGPLAGLASQCGLRFVQALALTARRAARGVRVWPG